MTLEWDMLSEKQKKALKLALKHDVKVSMTFLSKVYSTKRYAREALKTYNNNGLVESTSVGNKYSVVKEEIPDSEIPQGSEVVR